MTRQVTRLVADWSVGRLRTNGPLVSASGDLGGEAPVSERGDNQAAARVGGIRLRMTWRTERHQAVEIEVRAPLGALDDVVDLEGAPAATGVAPPAGARTTGMRSRVRSRLCPSSWWLLKSGCRARWLLGAIALVAAAAAAVSTVSVRSTMELLRNLAGHWTCP